MLWEHVLHMDYDYYYYRPTVRYNYLTVDRIPCDYNTARDKANSLRHLLTMIDNLRGGYGKFKCKNYIDIYPTGDKEKI